MTEQPKAPRRPRSSKNQPSVVLTDQALIIPLTKEKQILARTCLEKSGKITFTIKEITVSNLPETLLGDPVIVD